MTWDWEVSHQLHYYADELAHNDNPAAVGICLEFLLGDFEGLGHGRLRRPSDQVGKYSIWVLESPTRELPDGEFGHQFAKVKLVL